jgi:hypothetical protein
MIKLFGGMIIVIIGIAGIIANKKRITYFCNPPIEWWPSYPQSFIKKYFGQKYVIVFNYFIGVLFLLSGLYITYEGYCKILQP